jgi:hypothetical protein
MLLEILKTEVLKIRYLKSVGNLVASDNFYDPKVYVYDAK